jgi:5-methyltetrahydropteroyltriglutamate--homocysteine methyltransferase
MADGFRADHVGSLLRPPALLEAQAAHAEGRLTRDELRAAEDAAILTALDLQRQVGVDVFTDGEYRRSLFMSSLTDAVEGFVPVTSGPGAYEWSEEGAPDPHSPLLVVGAKLRQTRRLSAHEAAFLREHSPEPFKITMPAWKQHAAMARRRPSTSAGATPAAAGWRQVGTIPSRRGSSRACKPIGSC